MARMFLRDQDWSKIRPLLPSQEGKQGRPRKDDRLIIEGILWAIRTGAPWRDMPPEFGSWKTVYSRFYFWSLKGIWQKMWVFLKNRCISRMPHH